MDTASATSCIITGGAGFVGTHLVDYLIKEKRFEKIYVLDKRKPSRMNSVVEYINGDIDAPLSLVNVSTCDTCYHLAALCKEPGYDWDEYFTTNYVGTRNVCDLAERLNVRNMIFTSSMMVFRAGESRNSEESLTAPDTAYGSSKIMAELALREWLARAPGRRLRVVRPGVVFGKGESANFTRLYYALKGNRFAYVGSRDTVKGCIYVKDLVRFLDFVSSDGGDRHTFNLVYPKPVSIEDICRAFSEVFGISPLIPTIPYKVALFAGYLLEGLGAIGMKTGIHHRRVQKLYYSTDMSAEPAFQSGFKLQYSLRTALDDWRKECSPCDLF